ncbi:geranylgeranyl transferase type-2 subunit alpha-like [Saccostrea echinata]|uniref:geranylgeranyl transferase type-2 subunit alpha-like n=1 Tax=Saccostrea echinata TaxID=191078 RepID=UPI002A81D50F|nr:geranylgeranyl transferase type-2 subunit alpha-like [Saccostrea echinata]
MAPCFQSGESNLEKHGRLKVKTTAQQEEAKRKEREQKLKLYNAATSAAFKKRLNGEFDEEGLKITGEILSVNPDFYSLWNYRKEIFLFMKENKETDFVQKLMQDELGFLESCLKVNPKSYGAWHHRCFIMENMPNPDWERELQLCNTFLEYDERNFHCWDYRRTVVLASDVDLEQELAYTTEKIQTNFSNYSSWHYRSKLLPVIFPDPTHPVRVQEDILLQEHETVQNAIFTDPDDQSAWFYHRWLLGRGRKKLQISCVHASCHTNQIIVLLTNHIKVNHGHKLSVNINSTSIAGEWKNVKGSTNYSNIWIMAVKDGLQSEEDLSIGVTLLTESDCTQFSQGLQLNQGQEEAWTMAGYKAGTRFSIELSAAATSTLETELEGIKELHSVEPENKWVLLTLVYLMKAIDPVHERYEEGINEAINKLSAVDTKRRAFYWDLKSKFMIEKILDIQDVNTREMTLTGLDLTVLCHTEWMVLIQELDVSQNHLTILKPLSNLPCLKILIANNNKIETVEGLQHCKQLKKLHLQQNALQTVQVFTPLASLLLEEVNVAGNPLCNIENYTDSLRAVLPSLSPS